MEQRKTAYPIFSDAVVIVGASLFFGVLVTIPFKLLDLLLDYLGYMSGIVSSAFSLCIFVGVFWLTYRFAQRNVAFYNNGLNDEFAGKLSSLTLIIGVLMMIALKFVFGPIVEFMPNIEALDSILKQAFSLNLFSVIQAVIAAPLLEELIFRGVILKGFLRNYSPLKAILLSSFLFGVIHIIPGQVVASFFTGLLFGFIYWKTRSLLTSVLLHAINNGVILLLLFTIKDPSDSILEIVGNREVYYVLIVVSVFVMVLGYMFIYKKYKHANG